METFEQKNKKKSEEIEEQQDFEQRQEEERMFREHKERINRRLMQMRKEHEKQMRMRRITKTLLVLALVAAVAFVVVNHASPLKNLLKLHFKSASSETAASSESSSEELPADAGSSSSESASSQEESSTLVSYAAEETESTTDFESDIVSTYGILINADNMEVLSERDAHAKMYPASMTKVMTLLVAVDNLKQEQLDDTFEITIDITDFAYSNDCSAAGFEVGEKVTVRDLLYGLILPSGGDAAVALADYVAGSQEAFVDLMNAKLDEMGMSDSAHFTNCVGLYDENHYCTAYDMAMIMRAAMDNDLCKEVLSTHHYVTSATTEHPDGIELSNWFLRRIEDKDSGGTVLCGKTGYVIQSGSCAVSYAVDALGNNYICCTGNSSSSWQCIADQTVLYADYMTSQDELSASAAGNASASSDSADTAESADDAQASASEEETSNQPSSAYAVHAD